MNSEPFVGRDEILESIEVFLFNGDDRVLVIHGRPGMGKTALLREVERRLASDPRVSVSLLQPVDSGQSPEDTASNLCDALLQGRFFVRGPGDRRSLANAATAIPGIGPLVASLLQGRELNERTRLLAVLEALAKKTSKRPDNNRMVILLDPFTYLENPAFVDFFLILAKRAPGSARFIVAQRPTDVLLTTPRFRSAANVRLAGQEVQELGRADSAEMLRSLLGSAPLDPEVESTFWERYRGWPLAIQVGAIAVRDRGLDPRAVPEQLDRLFDELVRSCGTQARSLVRCCSIAPLDLFEEDLFHACGLSPEEYVDVVDEPVVQQLLVRTRRGDGVHVSLFHVLLRDFVRKYMEERGIPDAHYKQRLLQQLAAEVQLRYGGIDALDVTSRDAEALHVARKLLLYQGLLSPGESMKRVAELLLARVDRLRYGGRSYSLYSLLVIGRSGCLSLPASSLEDALRVLHRVLLEDSFLHPEYAVILIGSILVLHRAEICEEVRDICIKRLEYLRDGGRQSTKEVADRVLFAVERDLDPARGFELTELLPRIYSEEARAEVDEPAYSKAKERAALLAGIPVSSWSKDDADFMYRMITQRERAGLGRHQGEAGHDAGES